MDRPTIDSVVERLVDLECECAALKRQIRRWKKVGATALAGTVLLVIAGAWMADDKKLVVRELVVADGAGKPRIVLSVPDIGPMLEFRTPDGHSPFIMGLGGGPFPSDKPYLTFFGTNGPPRLGLGLGGGPIPDDSPHLNFRDKNGMPRLVLGVREGPGSSDNPFLNLRDKDGTLLFPAPPAKK